MRTSFSARTLVHAAVVGFTMLAGLVQLQCGSEREKVSRAEQRDEGCDGDSWDYTCDGQEQQAVYAPPIACLPGADYDSQCDDFSEPFATCQLGDPACQCLSDADCPEGIACSYNGYCGGVGARCDDDQDCCMGWDDCSNAVKCSGGVCGANGAACDTGDACLLTSVCAADGTCKPGAGGACTGDSCASGQQQCDETFGCWPIL
jgi:hypothetical protein